MEMHNIFYIEFHKMSLKGIASKELFPLSDNSA